MNLSFNPQHSQCLVDKKLKNIDKKLDKVKKY